MTPEFRAFRPIPRLMRDIVVTEKIDGTNAQVYVGEDGTLYAGSRNRWVTPENDNFGWAAWVVNNADALRTLGPGPHYGEWWGPGIQRGYGLAEKKFSLFNTSRWKENPDLPACCNVVPVLYEGIFNQQAISDSLSRLRNDGSVASPGFMRPEGVCIFHISANQLFKLTLEGDGHKGAQT